MKIKVVGVVRASAQICPTVCCRPNVSAVSQDASIVLQKFRRPLNRKMTYTWCIKEIETAISKIVESVKAPKCQGCLFRKIYLVKEPISAGISGLTRLML